MFLILLVKVSKSLYEIRDREVKLNTYAEYDFQAHLKYQNLSESRI